MYDDLLSAAALVGLAGLGTLVVIEAVDSPARFPAVAVESARPAGASVSARAAAASMPVYELPRVVVRGARSRDGDLVARGDSPAQAPPLVPHPSRDPAGPDIRR